MASSFAFHDLENRISHIESSRLKTQDNVMKPQRSVLGVINQNTSKADLSRKAKSVANQKLGGLKVHNSNTSNQSTKAIEKPNQQAQCSQYSSSILPRIKSSNSNAFPFKIHEDDSQDMQDKQESKENDKDYGNEENEAFDEYLLSVLHRKRSKNDFSLNISSNENTSQQIKQEESKENFKKHRYTKRKAQDEVAMLPQAFLKSKVWKDEEEEPMSLEKSILSPMSVDLSHTEKPKGPLFPSTRNPEDMVCILMNADDFRDDIYQYLLQCEKRIRPKPNYMRKQPDINAEMRSVLVDWLIEVAEEYKMENETLHLAINYVDRFLSLMSVVRSKLQLLGTAALFVASKYEEIYPPDVGEFVYITDDTYTKKQVLKMETLILKVLNFDLNIPTVHTFICHIVVSAHLGPSVLYMAQFFSELALVAGDPFLAFSHSQVACAAIALARFCLDYEEAWPATLETITGHTLDKLIEPVKCLHEAHCKVESSSQKAAYNKYKLNKWNNVSSVEPKTFTNTDPE